ncbi:MAG: hypothetical protein ACYC35_28240 [Pirellulales bacterium]
MKHLHPTVATIQHVVVIPPSVDRAVRGIAARFSDMLKVLPVVFSPGNRGYDGVGNSLGHAFAVGREI